MQPHHLIFLIRARAKPIALFLSGAGALVAAIPVRSSLVVATFFWGKLCGASRAVQVETKLLSHEVWSWVQGTKPSGLGAVFMK